MFKPNLPQHEQGFTLVEVLVAILITTLFVGVAMQSIVIATVFKARAKQFSEATTWIQEDLENVKSKATLQSTTLTTPVTATDTAVFVASVNRFEIGDQLKVGTDSTNNVIQSIDSATSTITLTDALGTMQSSGVSVELIRSTRCTGTPSLTTGFGDYLKNNLPALSSSTKNISGKTYTLTRGGSAGSAVPTVKPDAPFAVLELNYEVKEGSRPAIATTYTEVIPDAAFQCP